MAGLRAGAKAVVVGELTGWIPAAASIGGTREDTGVALSWQLLDMADGTALFASTGRLSDPLQRPPLRLARHCRVKPGSTLILEVGRNGGMHHLSATAMERVTRNGNGGRLTKGRTAAFFNREA